MKIEIVVGMDGNGHFFVHNILDRKKIMDKLECDPYADDMMQDREEIQLNLQANISDYMDFTDKQWKDFVNWFTCRGRLEIQNLEI